MRNFTVVQTRLSALGDKVVETNVIGEVATKAAALDFLDKRGYTYDTLRGAYIRGNTVQYPVTIVEPKYDSVFDIRSFV